MPENSESKIVSESSRIMGFDPGLATAGFGVIEREGRGRYRMIAHGDFTSKAGEPLAQRLKQLAVWVRAAIEEHQPDEFAVEEMFFALNVKTAVQMAHARGVCLAVAAEADLPVAEYSALSIKQSVAGYGRADKDQVAKMVIRSLNLTDEQIPDTSHATDGLAVALCHAASKVHPSMAKLAQARASVVGKGSRRRSKASWRNFKPPEKKKS